MPKSEKIPITLKVGEWISVICGQTACCDLFLARDSGIEKNMLEVVLATPTAGSVITTQIYIGQVEKGEEKILKQGTYYYSVDNGVIMCNGKPLRKDFPARFVGEVEERCLNSSGMSSDRFLYNKFELLNKLSA